MATSFGRAAGMPDYGPTGTSGFIPVLWSKMLVKRWYPATVLTHISNTNYEGEIKGMGSKVEIRTEGDVPVYLNRYQRGGTLPPPDRIESPKITLEIDQNTDFYYGIDSIDKHQSDIDLMSQWADGALKNTKVKIDTDVLAYYCGTSPYSTSPVDTTYNTGNTAGKIHLNYTLGASGAPYQLTSANVIRLITRMEATLGEQNVPDDVEWFFVIPRVVSMLIKNSDLKDASMTKDDLTHEETRKAVDLIIDRTNDFHKRGLDVDILTVDNHSDGPYLYMRMVREGNPRADEVMQLLKWNGGNSSGIGIADVDNVGNVHADQFWWHSSSGNVRQRKFGDIWMDTSDPLMRGLKNRRPLLKGRCSLCQYLDLCGGNLRVRAEATYGDVWAPDPACYLTDEEIGLDRSPLPAGTTPAAGGKP